MKTIIKITHAIIAATFWISISEFVRNQFLLQTIWIAHYQNLGLNFPTAPVNGALWGLWSLLFAIVIYILSRKFTLLQCTLLSWFVGFVLMWIVIGNLGVLPIRILGLAVPLSLLESFIASWMVKKIAPQ